MPTLSLSIIIPAYNAAEFLGATIRSCLGVRPEPREIIVVDDGSTDGTPAVCAAFAGQIRAERVANGGVSRARNLGAGLAVGDWLLFLDADDLLLPSGPAALLEAALAARAGVAYGGVHERQPPPLEPRRTGGGHAAGSPPNPALRNYWRSAVITPGSAVVRRDLHGRVGGFVPGYEPMEDRDYWIKCGLLEPCAFADEVVLDKTWRPVSAGKMDAKRIWNGLRSRLALPAWCAEHGVALPEGLPRAARTLFTSAVKEALWFGCWDVLGPLLAACRERRLRGFWITRAGAEFLLRGGFRRHPAPAWLGNHPLPN